MAFLPSTYHKNMYDMHASKYKEHLSDASIYLIEHRLDGKLLGTSIRYIPEVISYDVFNRTNYDYDRTLKTETVVQVEMNANTIDKFAMYIHSTEKENFDSRIAYEKQLLMNIELTKLIEKNPACKKAWDNFIMCTKLAGASDSLTTSLDNKLL